jgi:L-rhamnose mutarotase
MKRLALVMYLYSGKEAEYKKTHNDIWPEMKKALKEHGATNYSIFLDETTGNLFAYLEVPSIEKYNKISETKICQKWWEYMAPLMKTNNDNSPIETSLTEVFHLE